MPSKRVLIIPSLILLLLIVFLTKLINPSPRQTGAPPYGEAESEVPIIDPYAWIRDWRRPDGPPQVGVQVGHWKNDQAPEEQKRLRNNNGASSAGVDEVDINYAIALKLKQFLETEGVYVDLLPTTISPDYWADVFISIHADGSEDSSSNGYKFAGPWRDITGKSSELIHLIETEYASATGFSKDPNISRNMRGYYAFSWWRYDHAIHPMTTGVIAETGFVTNPSNRRLLSDRPEIPAQAIASGIIKYLDQQGLLAQTK